MTQIFRPDRTRRPLQFTCRKTSDGRLWNGFHASLYDVTSGYSYPTSSASHKVTMLVGQPVGTIVGCDGRISRRLQTTGEIDIIPAGYRALWHDEGPSTFLTICLSPSLMTRTAEGMGVNADSASIAPGLGVNDRRIQLIAWALKEELESNDSLGLLYADSLGVALASQLLARYRSSARRRPERDVPKRRLNHVIDYIHDNLSAELTLAELAKVAGLSESHFKVVFKSSIGMPVHQYVVRRRVDSAMALVRAGNRSLTDVALTVGFSDPSHMSRWMRKVAGVTPGALMRE